MPRQPRIAGPQKRKEPPAATFEDREQQLVAYAVDLAEKQILEGTATSQVITHYLKLGTTRERLEQERLRNENALLKARLRATESGDDIKELYTQALAAMRKYSGSTETYDD